MVLNENKFYFVKNYSNRPTIICLYFDLSIDHLLKFPQLKFSFRKNFFLRIGVLTIFTSKIKMTDSSNIISMTTLCRGRVKARSTWASTASSAMCEMYRTLAHGAHIGVNLGPMLEMVLKIEII